MNPQLFIMVKEPLPGRVKTRLGKDIGMINAAWWFRHQTRSLIRRLSDDPRWQTVIAVTPDHAGLQSRVWPSSVSRWPQGPGNLGCRMRRIFRHAPPGPVVIVGADIPRITADLISKAFRELGENDAVFGPAPDGGYWLVGLKRSRAIPKTLFDNVRWSTDHTLADTVSDIPDLSIAYVDELRDVDTIADLK